MRELALLCYAENLLSDDEFRVPWEDNRSKNAHFLWDKYSFFDPQNMDEPECKVEFWVQKEIFPRLDMFWRFHQLLSANKRLYAMAWKESIGYKDA